MGDSPRQRSLSSLSGSRESRNRPSILGGIFHPLLVEYLSPATPWCPGTFFVTECLEIGRTPWCRGGRHHGVVPTLRESGEGLSGFKGPGEGGPGASSLPREAPPSLAPSLSPEINPSLKTCHFFYFFVRLLFDFFPPPRPPRGPGARDGRSFGGVYQLRS